MKTSRSAIVLALCSTVAACGVETDESKTVIPVAVADQTPQPEQGDGSTTGAQQPNQDGSSSGAQQPNPDAEESAEPASIKVLLTDAPGDYEQVPITIASVEANLVSTPTVQPAGDGGAGGAWSSGGGGASGGGVGVAGASGAPAADDVEAAALGWRTLVDTPGTYDLLELQGGVTAALGDAEIPAGTYSQLRLVLSDASVVVDGETFELTVPSGEQSGLKLNFDFVVESGKTYQMLLDFDAQSSIKKAGPKYLLTPVITVKSFAAGQEEEEEEAPEDPEAGGPPPG